MKNVEFCYWIQGYFELSGDTGSISHVQVNIIKAHLALVKKVEGKLDEFASWLCGVLDATGDGMDISVDMTAMIKEKLGAKFKHEIDPKYSGSQTELNKIHGSVSTSGQVLYRC